MPEPVEAEKEEAKRSLSGLRDILGIPKSELDDRVKRQKRKQKRGRAKTKKKTTDGHKGL